MHPISIQLPRLPENSSARGNNRAKASSEAVVPNVQALQVAQSLDSATDTALPIQTRSALAGSESIDFEDLVSLAPEILAKIFSYLSQQDICGVLAYISDIILQALGEEHASTHKRLEALKANKNRINSTNRDNLIAEHNRSLKISNRHWSIKLLDLALRELNMPVVFDPYMLIFVRLQKACGFKEFLYQAPSLRIDFKYNKLSYKIVMDVLQKMSIGVKQLELYGIDTTDICLSLKNFPHLQTLSIGYSNGLESLTLKDEHTVLKEIKVQHCPALKILNIEAACSTLKHLDFEALESLEQITIPAQTKIEAFSIKNDSLAKLNLERLASSLEQSCKKLRLHATGIILHPLWSIQAFISKLKQLEEIELRGLGYDDVKIINILKAHPWLEEIILEGEGFEVDLAGYACATSLKTLILEGPIIKDIGSLNQFTALECLEIGHMNADTGRVCDALASLKNLKRMILRNLDIKNLDFLRELPHLKELILNSCQNLEPSCLDVISSLKGLEILKLNYLKITNLDFLNTLTNIKHLSLHLCKDLESDGFNALTALTELRTLDLGVTPVQNLDFLKMLSHLEKLSLAFCEKLTLESFKMLSALPKLKSLSLEGIFNEKDCIKLDFLETIPALEELDLGSARQLSQENCECVMYLKKLKKLKIQHASCLEDIDFLKDLTALEELDLMSCMGLKSEKLSVLNHLTKLRKLNLSSIPVEDLTFLKGLKYLDWISLASTTAFNLSSPELDYLPSSCTVFGLFKPEEEQMNYSSEGDWSEEFSPGYEEEGVLSSEDEELPESD